MNGKVAVDFVHPDFLELIEERLNKLNERKQILGSNEGMIVRVDGQSVEVEVSTELITYQNQEAVQILIKDISARKLEEERLERQVEELAVLHSIAVAAAQATSEDELIEEATMIVGSVLFPRNFGFLLIDEESQTLLLHNSYRFESEAPRGDVLSIPLGHGITGAVAQTGAAIRIGDVSVDARYLDIHSNIRSELCVPIKSGQKVLGVINSESDELYAFNEADECLLQTIAGQLAAGIEKVRFFEEMQRLAVTDSLTHLNNRRYFFDLARSEFERARRFQHSLVAIMLDVDEFRGINEKFGHAGGDLTLNAIAYSWMQELREVDVIGRYGGDEFAILLLETDLKAGKEVAERLCKISKAMTVESERGTISVTTSIGVASLLDNSQNIENLID